MMNVVAICLVLTSLAAAGVLSPGPEKQSSDRKNDDVILKEGHRVFVVEYDQDGLAKTKVSISPEHDHVPIKPASVSNLEGNLYQGDKDVLERSKDKVKEAASSVTPEQKEDGGGHGYTGVKELICDAFGKCKHRIASGLDKAKEEVTENVHEVEEDARGRRRMRRRRSCGGPGRRWGGRRKGPGRWRGRPSRARGVPCRPPRRKGRRWSRMTGGTCRRQPGQRRSGPRRRRRKRRRWQAAWARGCAGSGRQRGGTWRCSLTGGRWRGWCICWGSRWLMGRARGVPKPY